MSPQNPTQEKEDLVPAGRGRWVLAFFVAALVITFFAGFFVQRSFFTAEPKDSVSVLDRALHSKSSADSLRVEFPGVKNIPQGPGLNEWLDGFPQPERIQNIKASFVSVYSFDANGEWDLQLDPIKEVATLQAPLPEFTSLRFSSSDIEITASPALSTEEIELARRFLEERLRRVLSQEEEERSDARLEACKKHLLGFSQAMLDRERIGEYKIDLILASDFVGREEL